MSGGILTDAGRDLFAAKQGAGQVLTVDRFMLANIVGLDPNSPADPAETLPAPGDQVATLPVTQSGYVSADKVVYSLYLGTQVGDFTFNWVGLLADDDTLVAVRYIEPISKYATSGQDLGNAITRNFLITYTDAQAITNVTVEASSWQIQFDQASTEIRGMVELATQAEMDAGADTSRVPPVNTVADYTGNVITNASAYTDNGAANAYVLTPSGGRKGPQAYRAGAVYEFIAANANTGPSTVNVAGLGVKNIKLAGGSNPAEGQISGRTSLVYDHTNDHMELIYATESRSGPLRCATQSQTDAGADDTTAVTPKKLRWGFAASLSTSGYLAFPSWLGGVVFQWGTITSVNNTTATWPITFPKNCWAVVACDSTVDPDNPSYAHIISIKNPTVSGFTFGIRLHDGSASSGSAWYLSVGN